MSSIRIQISVTEHGIDQITARGKTSEDRAETLRVLTRIEPQMTAIDRELSSTEEK